MSNPNRPKRLVKRFYNPPTLVAKQVFSVLRFSSLIGWEKLTHWFWKRGKVLHAAAGAIGMGCIGFANHCVWEVTTACNLGCRHCHASGGKPMPGELSTEEGKRLLEEIASIDEFRLLVFTGGEPLVRPDILELIEYASNLGLEPKIATNATLITPQIARRFKDAGDCDVAIGLDGASARVHELIRGVPGSFDRTMRGIYATKEAGLALQINIAAMKHNYHEIPFILDLADGLDAEIVLIYHFVPIGRGEGKEDLELSPQQVEDLAKLVSQRQRKAKPIIQPTCAPYYWAYISSRNGNSRLGLRLSEAAFKGCTAGRGMCYIKADGDVWPCPFVPVTAGNIRNASLAEIWHGSDVFQSLRSRENLKGKCGECGYHDLCGGCRGRAYAHFGDYLAEDPLCFMSPGIKDE